MICNNCGLYGHISRTCNKPIRSYGVLLIKDIKKDSKLVLVNRKDSICYIDIVRGKYDITNTNKLKLLLSRITKNEFNKLANKSFEYIWKDLWLLNNVKQTNEYLKCKKKHEELLKVLNNYKNCPVYLETEWEFPKGKKKINELYQNAAKRELQEETNIYEDDYELIININSIKENIVGEDNINYQNVYYLGICKNTDNIKINKNNIHQTSEINDIGIFTKDESIKLIRDYNKSKINIINKVYDFIENYNNDLILK